MRIAKIVINKLKSSKAINRCTEIQDHGGRGLTASTQVLEPRFSQRYRGGKSKSGHFASRPTPCLVLPHSSHTTIIHPILRRLAKIHSESDLLKATPHIKPHFQFSFSCMAHQIKSTDTGRTCSGGPWGQGILGLYIITHRVHPWPSITLPLVTKALSPGRQ